MKISAVCLVATVAVVASVASGESAAADYASCPSRDCQNEGFSHKFQSVGQGEGNYECVKAEGAPSGEPGTCHSAPSGGSCSLSHDACDGGATLQLAAEAAIQSGSVSELRQFFQIHSAFVELNELNALVVYSPCESGHITGVFPLDANLAASVEE